MVQRKVVVLFSPLYGEVEKKAHRRAAGVVCPMVMNTRTELKIAFEE